MSISAAAAINERAARAGRAVARAEDALFCGERVSELGRAREFLGRAVTASLRGDDLAEAESANAAEMWAMLALARTDRYSSEQAAEITADDPDALHASRAEAAGEEYA